MRVAKFAGETISSTSDRVLPNPDISSASDSRLHIGLLTHGGGRILGWISGPYPTASGQERKRACPLARGP